MQKKWFVIVNPTSGNCTARKLWPKIEHELQVQLVHFETVFTEHKNHAFKLVQQAIDKGFLNIISVGGDGSLHNIINGIFNYNSAYKHIKLGVIPIGTGNDWVKTYNIPIDYKKAIEIIKAEHSIYQDIGKISLENSQQNYYFNNVAGIGFDGYVVHKVHKYKNLGFLAYLSGAVLGLLNYKRPDLKITFNNTTLKGKCLLLFIGIGKYSGGGMQLTENVDTKDGLFDISYVKKLSLFTLLKNISKIFSGKVTALPIVNTYKTSTLKVTLKTNKNVYLQADGELLKTDSFTVTTLPKALQFIVPKTK
ncbi:MAG TPA: diacylglycerol kinase family protein [Flavobacteriaceae bacterium]|nr:diacylglycerol kinase family protein [Flavobacteriaceae bacterium]